MKKNDQSLTSLGKRPPIVAVLGHVDHGKTTLLDAVRKSNVAQQEAGGITQHIGAYQIEFASKKVTFIDTPGHAVFKDMRLRGVTAADIAILVVAANEGVKPQTIEAIGYINEQKIPFVVAINKVDLAQDAVEKVKKQLAEAGVKLEEFGGEIVVVPISAKTGAGVKELLEVIELISELTPIPASADNPFTGVIIESSLDSKRGPVATIITRDGSLKIGDEIATNGCFGKVRAMTAEPGLSLRVAPPGTPVQILGFDNVPPAGAKVESRKLNLDYQIDDHKLDPLSQVKAREEIKGKFKIILKSDATGSGEAIMASLPNNVHVVSASCGEISENDLQLAKVSKASIYAFGIKIPKQIAKLARLENLKIKEFKVVYQLLDDIAKELETAFRLQTSLKVAARAKVVAKFLVDGKRIAGCQVLSGSLKLNSPVKIVRGRVEVGRARIVQMRQKKKEVESCAAGAECGILLEPQLDFVNNDIIELATAS